MTDRYQGDPKLTLDENGSDLTFKGGQPEMDRGLENAVFISLFTKESWVGNALFTDINQQIGSDFLDTVNQPITVTALNDIANSAERALQWMIDSDIAANITARATNPRNDWIEVAILIEPPTADPVILLAKQNGVNWSLQKIDPAYLRVN
jgi:phage gp46-like protein